LCGCTITFRLVCNTTVTPPIWELHRNILCPNAGYPNWTLGAMSESCDEFQLVFGSSCDLCCPEPGQCGLLHTVTK
jgi:hypothetical protein